MSNKRIESTSTSFAGGGSPVRLHPTLGYVSPITHELLAAARQEPA